MEKPILLATHPRSCSTAFERVLLTRAEDIECFHEPFGDAFYFGPERMNHRFDDDEEKRHASGCTDVTYGDVLQNIWNSCREKRVFIKDMAFCLIPPEGQVISIPPSLNLMSGIPTSRSGATVPNDALTKDAAVHSNRVSATQPNPTIFPAAVLQDFHITFLIRDPRLSIPSLYRCSVPPKSETTGLHGFQSIDIGFRELRILFDYLKSRNTDTKAQPCVVDATRLMQDPEGVLEAYCKSVNLPFNHSMLQWDTAKDKQRAEAAFERWEGFHEVAIESTSLIQNSSSVEGFSMRDNFVRWTEEFGIEGARTIEANILSNLSDYLYLKSFAF